MHTELGKIKILINGIEIPYESIELIKYNHYFSVKGRIKLVCNVPEQLKKNIKVECIIESPKDIKIKSGTEIGENLALISFYGDKSKLSIGTLGDIPGVKYIYSDNGMCLELQKNPRRVVFYVAWLEMTDPEKEDIYTWFAADPAFDD